METLFPAKLFYSLQPYRTSVWFVVENERYTYCTRSLGEASLSTYCKVSMSYTGGNCVPIDCHPLELYTCYVKYVSLYTDPPQSCPHYRCRLFARSHHAAGISRLIGRCDIVCDVTLDDSSQGLLSFISALTLYRYSDPNTSGLVFLPRREQNARL